MRKVWFRSKHRALCCGQHARHIDRGDCGTSHFPVPWNRKICLTKVFAMEGRRKIYDLCAPQSICLLSAQFLLPAFPRIGIPANELARGDALTMLWTALHSTLLCSSYHRLLHSQRSHNDSVAGHNPGTCARNRRPRWRPEDHRVCGGPHRVNSVLGGFAVFLLRFRGDILQWVTRNSHNSLILCDYPLGRRNSQNMYN